MTIILVDVFGSDWYKDAVSRTPLTETPPTTWPAADEPRLLRPTAHAAFIAATRDYLLALPNAPRLEVLQHIAVCAMCGADTFNEEEEYPYVCRCTCSD